MRPPPPVTFVVDGPLSQLTGGTLYDRLVVEGLRARGGAVRVVSLLAGGAGPSRLGAAAGAILDGARVTRELRRSPDGGVVIVDELCHPRAALPAWLGRPGASCRRPLCVLVHHLAASERSGLPARVVLGVERLLLRGAERLVVTSATTRAVLVAAGLPAPRIRVVLPGRDRLGTRAAPPAPAPGGGVRLLFVGSLTPRKGALLLLRAFAAVAARATLTMAGPVDRDPAHARAVLSEAARWPSRVRVTGALADGALARLLDEHDVMVAPSFYEGFGIALAEGLSHGLAVVASSAGAIPELVRDGKEALLVPAGDEGALARALERVVDDAGRRLAMQHHALERAASLPRWADTQRAFAAALPDPG